MQPAVILLSPYFPPSNLAGVHRVRLMSAHLADFGWEPIVITVNADRYEEESDPGSVALIRAGLNVERVGAWPSGLCRLFGVGDMSLRAHFHMRRRVEELVGSGRGALLFATVLPGYTGLVAAWAKRKFGLPFVLDYQDPWVTSAGALQSRLSKAGIAHWLALKMEPSIVKLADAVTAVSDGTLDTLRRRSLLNVDKPVEIIPIGAEAEDQNVARLAGKSWLGNEVGVFNICYVGTLTERMLPALRAVLKALVAVATSGQRVRLNIIGTSGRPDGNDWLGVLPLAQEIRAAGLIRLEPKRIGYLDALRTMQEADLLLLLGSIDKHYTASKLFPSWLSETPILGLVHADSTVVKLSHELGGVRLVLYTDDHGPDTKIFDVEVALRDLLGRGGLALPVRRKSAFESYSGRGVTASFASLFDRLTRNTPGT